MEGVIDLSAEDERLLDVVIKFLYGDYEFCNGRNLDTFTIFDFMHLRETAARLGVPHLAKSTILDFIIRLEEPQKTPWPESLESLVNVLYDDTTKADKELRTALVDYVVERLGRCGKDERSSIEQVINDHDSTLLSDVAVSLTNTIRKINHADHRIQSREGRNNRAWYGPS